MRRYHHRRSRRKSGIIAALSLLILAAFYILRQDQIEKWLITVLGTRLISTKDCSSPLCLTDPEQIPVYDGDLYVELNGNIPSFTEYDLTHIQGESYSGLDYLGRCGSAIALLDRSMMPTEERGEIGMVRPTGWIQNKYPGIVESDPPYLYHRCHLIAFALTGQNANEKNLITGTQCMNTGGMLPWELKVLRYLDKSDNHVLYRVTPFFEGYDLLSRGVEMEAYSVEDKGRDVCFHVFVYNVQPGIAIDYRTGENWAA